MAVIPTKRLGWLVKRLSRMYVAEVPYRAASVARAVLQKRGYFDASSLPPRSQEASFGAAWVRVPDAGHVNLEEVLERADEILSKGIRVFDVDISLDVDTIDWNVDPKTGTRIPSDFGLAIDFRHIANGVDIKYLWELNRHVWWVPLAQAYALSGKQHYLVALGKFIDSWIRECPYPFGANWSSPVEHGIRLINWSIVWHLIGGSASPLFSGANGQALLERWMTSIYQHIRFASDNYSFYSSADNHLIGEAAGVFVAANTWRQWDEVMALGKRAKTILEHEMLKQFAEDGVNREQAFCYHKFSLEFLIAALLSGEAAENHFSAGYRGRLLAAIRFLAAMTDCDAGIPSIGDSDDGQVFRFVGDGSRTGYVATLMFGLAYFGATDVGAKLRQLGMDHLAGSWLNTANRNTDGSFDDADTLPTVFKNGGYVLFGRDLHTPQELRVIMDVGALGYNRIAGHGHADALSILLAIGGKNFLIDSGTYCYNAAPDLRHYFRGTSAHNTVVIDEQDQSIYGGSFLWLRDIATTVHAISDSENVFVVEASHNGYMRLRDPVRHIRKASFDHRQSTLTVEDRFECSSTHKCAINWHFAPECAIDATNDGWEVSRDGLRLQVEVNFPDSQNTIAKGQEHPPMGWISKHFYERQATPVLHSEGVCSSSTVIVSRFRLVSV